MLRSDDPVATDVLDAQSIASTVSQSHSHTGAREQGETTHRLVATDLDLSTLEAEEILQAL